MKKKQSTNKVILFLITLQQGSEEEVEEAGSKSDRGSKLQAIKQGNVEKEKHASGLVGRKSAKIYRPNWPVKREQRTEHPPAIGAIVREIAEAQNTEQKPC
ncbi:hypothetical protein T08_13701 [Trichinella sp. T8]|nr:hypothetical protein T08_13701 [Trichinella sp. T8]